MQTTSVFLSFSKTDFLFVKRREKKRKWYNRKHRRKTSLHWQCVFHLSHAFTANGNCFNEKPIHVIHIEWRFLFLFIVGFFCVCLNSFFINLQRFNHDFLSTVSCMKDLKHTKSANGFQLNEYSISFFLPLFTLF